MSFERAKKHLKKYGFENKIEVFEISSATVKEAAKALNCQEGEIAKSITFLVNEKPILIVAAGDAKINNIKFKAEFQTKAKMIAFEEVETLIGHGVGGVCPFGVNKEVRIFLDETLKRFDTVYPACGSSNSTVKLELKELELASNFEKWIDVCKL